MSVKKQRLTLCEKSNKEKKKIGLRVFTLPTPVHNIDRNIKALYKEDGFDVIAV